MPRECQDIHELLSFGEMPRDEGGGLHGLSLLIADLEPALTLIVDRFGTAVSVQEGTTLDASEINSVARDLALRLTAADWCVFDRYCASGTYSAFAWKLPADADGAIVGGLVRMSANAAQQLTERSAALIVSGTLAWNLTQSQREVARLLVRNRQMRAEHDMLKATQSDAVAAAIDEHEERIRAQHTYAVHLEDEVERRSRALKEAKEAAEQFNLAKSEFLANMSHEIRTPMTAILGFAEVLSSNLERPENRVAIATIRRNGEYLLEVINDILDLSKIEAGKLYAEPISCSTCNIVADVASLMRVRADAKSLPLETEFLGPIPSATVTDPTRLRQILINLVGNAIKFTKNGSVRLSVTMVKDARQATYLRFDVVDTGIGMSQEDLQRLFSPFSQVDASTTRLFGGTGLGLAISKRLAEMLHGTIDVVSIPGQGSTFSLMIPTGSLDDVMMLESPAESMVVTPAVAESAASQILSCRVLLAEDGPDNQRLISFFLQKAGADVALASNGRIAMELALRAWERGTPFDVLLMDMQMPEVDGYDATRKLRDAGYDLPIIALTAHAMQGEREKCMAAGCTDYATKPIDRNALIETIQRYAGTRANS